VLPSPWPDLAVWSFVTATEREGGRHCFSGIPLLQTTTHQVGAAHARQLSFMRVGFGTPSQSKVNGSIPATGIGPPSRLGHTEIFQGDPPPRIWLPTRPRGPPSIHAHPSWHPQIASDFLQTRHSHHNRLIQAFKTPYGTFLDARDLRKLRPKKLLIARAPPSHAHCADNVARQPPAHPRGVHLPPLMPLQPAQGEWLDYYFSSGILLPTVALVYTSDHF
jgi:hypothetical protein